MTMATTDGWWRWDDETDDKKMSPKISLIFVAIEMPQFVRKCLINMRISGIIRGRKSPNKSGDGIGIDGCIKT